MITNFTSQLTSPFEVIGNKLRIHFDETEVVRDGETSYNYTTATVHKYSNRSEIIEALMRAKYTIGEEFALINNKEDSPSEYEQYQGFRTQAKNLADQWLGE